MILYDNQIYSHVSEKQAGQPIYLCQTFESDFWEIIQI